VNCGGVQGLPCPFVPFLASGSFAPCLAFDFRASNVDGERHAFPVVFGCEVVSFWGGHLASLKEAVGDHFGKIKVLLDFERVEEFILTADPAPIVKAETTGKVDLLFLGELRFHIV
jgi:hypothetical protein